MAETRQLTVKMAIQSADYKKQLKAINTQNKLLKSEFDSLSDSSDNFENSLKGQTSKLKLLDGQLNNAKQKMSIYTKEVKKCEDTLDEVTKSYEKQQEEIKDLELRLQGAKKLWGESSSKVKELEKSLEESNKALKNKEKAIVNSNDALQRMKINVNNTQKEINQLEKEVSQCTKELNTMENETKDLDKELNNLNSFSFDNITEKFSGMSGKVNNSIQLVSKLSTSFVKFGVDSVKWLGKVTTNTINLSAKLGLVTAAISGASIKISGEFKAIDEMMEATFGKNLSNAKNRIENLAKSTGIAFGRLEQPFSQFYSQLKGSGLEAEESLKRTEQGLGLVSDAAAYYNMSMEESSELLRSFIRGNTEAGDRIGLFTSETQRNTKSLATYGKKWNELTEAQKQMLMLDISEEIYKQSGAIGQAKREADGLENVLGNLTYNTKDFFASIGNNILDDAIKQFKDLGNILGESSKIIKEQGLSSAFNYMIDEITNKLNSMSENIPSTMEKLINSMSNFLNTNLPRIIDLGTNIITNIGIGITQNEDEITNGISTVLQNISNFINNNMPTIMQIGKTLIESIGIAIDNNKESIRTAIYNLVYTASTLFLEYKVLIINTALELGGAFIQGLWQGIWNSSQNYKPTNDNFYLPKVEDAQKKGEEYGIAWITSSGKVLNSSPSLWETLFSKDTYTKVSLDAENTAYAYVNGVKVKVSEQTPQIQEVIKNLLNSSGLEKEKGKYIGNNVADGIKEGIENKTQEVTNAVDNTTKKATEIAKTESQNLKDEVSKSLEGIGNIATDSTGKIPEATKRNLSESAKIIRQFGSDAYNGVKTSFSKLESTSKQSFSNLYNGCSKSISKLKEVTMKDATTLYLKSKNSFDSLAKSGMSAYSRLYNNCMNSINKLKINTINTWNSIRNALSRNINGKVNITRTTTSIFDKSSRSLPFDSLQNTLSSYGNNARINTRDINNIALSGSYYNQRTKSSNEIGIFANNSVSSKRNSYINVKTDTSRLEELIINLIDIITIQNNLIENNSNVLIMDSKNSKSIATATAPYMVNAINNINNRKNRLGGKK